MGKMQKALRKTAERATAAAGQAAGPGVLGHGLARLDVDQRLMVLRDPECVQAQQVRHLRDNILTLAGQNGFRIFAVTSSKNDEQRAVMTANLACALADDTEAQIVLVDADMRHPSMHEIMVVDNDRGLSDYLKGGTMLELVLQRSRLPNLWVLPAGATPPDPAELLGNKRMDDLMGRLRRDYTFVLIDAPGMLEAPEAPGVITRANGTLLVVRMHHTARDVAKDAMRAIKAAEANLLGSVLTGM